MSRLHRQKLRLRAMQREDGIIEPDADELDKDALETDGSTHSRHLDEPEENDEPAAEARAAPRKTTKRKAKAKRR